MEIDAVTICSKVGDVDGFASVMAFSKVLKQIIILNPYNQMPNF